MAIADILKKISPIRFERKPTGKSIRGIGAAAQAKAQPRVGKIADFAKDTGRLAGGVPMQQAAIPISEQLSVLPPSIQQRREFIQQRRSRGTLGLPPRMTTPTVQAPEPTRRYSPIRPDYFDSLPEKDREKTANMFQAWDSALFELGAEPIDLAIWADQNLTTAKYKPFADYMTMRLGQLWVAPPKEYLKELQGGITPIKGAKPFSEQYLTQEAKATSGDQDNLYSLFGLTPPNQ